MGHRQRPAEHRRCGSRVGRAQRQCGRSVRIQLGADRAVGARPPGSSGPGFSWTPFADQRPWSRPRSPRCGRGAGRAGCRPAVPIGFGALGRGLLELHLQGGRRNRRARRQHRCASSGHRRRRALGRRAGRSRGLCRGHWTHSLGQRGHDQRGQRPPTQLRTGRWPLPALHNRCSERRRRQPHRSGRLSQSGP